MEATSRQRGESKIGCLIWLLLGLLFILVAVKVVPIKIATMKLQDHMEELATIQGKQGKDFFEREIYNKAKYLKLPIARKQIRVKKHPERVIIDVEFTYPVEIVGYTYDWDISINVDQDVYWF